MTREETLLEAARQALHVLNMLWDDERTQDILKARSDLDTALKEYELKDISEVINQEVKEHKEKYQRYLLLFESYTRRLLGDDAVGFINKLNSIIDKTWAENVPSVWGLRVKPYYSSGFRGGSRELRIHNGSATSRIVKCTILDLKEGYTFSSKSRVKQLKLNHPLWDIAATRIYESMVICMTPKEQELCAEVQGIIAKYMEE